MNPTQPNFEPNLVMNPQRLSYHIKQRPVIDEQQVSSAVSLSELESCSVEKFTEQKCITSNLG